MNKIDYNFKQSLTNKIISNLNDWESLLNQKLMSYDESHITKAFKKPVSLYKEETFNINYLSFSLTEEELMQDDTPQFKGYNEEEAIIRNEFKLSTQKVLDNFSVKDYKPIPLFLDDNLEDLKISPRLYYFCKDVYNGKHPNFNEMNSFVHKTYDECFPEYPHLKKYSKSNVRRHLKQISDDIFLGFEYRPNLYKKLNAAVNVMYPLFPMIVLVNKGLDPKTIKIGYHFSPQNNDGIAGLFFQIIFLKILILVF